MKCRVSLTRYLGPRPLCSTRIAGRHRSYGWLRLPRTAARASLDHKTSPERNSRKMAVEHRALCFGTADYLLEEFLPAGLAQSIDDQNRFSGLRAGRCRVLERGRMVVRKNGRFLEPTVGEISGKACRKLAALQASPGCPPTADARGVLHPLRSLRGTNQPLVVREPTFHYRLSAYRAQLTRVEAVPDQPRDGGLDDCARRSRRSSTVLNSRASACLTRVVPTTGGSLKSGTNSAR
jgi:hypothetical protein